MTIATPSAVWIYARVSTTKQDTENQLLGCRAYAREKGWHIDRLVEDEISAQVNWRDRRIGHMIHTADPDTVIIVSEISRLARRTLECLEIFQEAAGNRVSIVCVKNGLTMDGGMQSKIIATVLGMAAEIERDMINSRTREALARRRAEGLPMGRPVGATSASKLEPYAGQIADLRRRGVSETAISKILQCSRTTLRNFKPHAEATK